MVGSQRTDRQPVMVGRLERTSPVRLGTMLRGYEEAVARFKPSAAIKDADSAFIALFEALNWTASIDDGLRYPDHLELRAVRFARNCVHHQWADAVILTGGIAFPMRLPVAIPPMTWVWRDTLPPPVDPQKLTTYERQRPRYENALAGRPVIDTLEALSDFFASVQ
jgi:hypothetical protein